MLYGIIGALVIVIIVLSIKLRHKAEVEADQIEETKKTLWETNSLLDKAKLEVNHKVEQLDALKQQISKAEAEYHDAIVRNAEDLNNYVESQRATRTNALEYEFNSKKAVYEQTLQEVLKQCEEQIAIAQESATEIIGELQQKIRSYEQAVQYEQQKYEALLEPLKQYEKDKQAKLFYTICLPDEYKEDIDFLLNTVTMKVQHPDIISKLVWAEYVKPYLDETFKRVGIKAEPGIYKLTNIDSGKAYVGKSTDIKKRIQDHFKSSVGIKSIADQFVHHEILRTGFWNWSIEYIIYCDKDDLNELEKYYIDFFKTQEFGYNRKEGG